MISKSKTSIWGSESEDIKTNDFKTKSDSISPAYYSCSITENPMLNVTFSVGDGFSGGGFQIDIFKADIKSLPIHILTM